MLFSSAALFTTGRRNCLLHQKQPKPKHNLPTAYWFQWHPSPNCESSPSRSQASKSQGFGACCTFKILTTITKSYRSSHHHFQLLLQALSQHKSSWKSLQAHHNLTEGLWMQLIWTAWKGLPTTLYFWHTLNQKRQKYRFLAQLLNSQVNTGLIVAFYIQLSLTEWTDPEAQEK